MSCPPNPGILAYLGCVLAMLLDDPLRLVALLLSLGAALSAILLARSRADHRPIAWALGGLWLADVLGWILAPELAAEGPYVGWQRAAQHVDSARFLVWPLALQVMVGLAFVNASARRCAARALWVALPSFYAFLLAICVACYPSLRTEALGRFYACVQANAVLWALVMIAPWGIRALRRSTVEVFIRAPEREPIFTPARAVASLAVALELLSLVAGPWWRGLFGAAYRAEQMILVVLYGAIVGVQLWAWRRAVGRAMSRPT